MKFKELKALGVDELTSKLTELRMELMKQNTQRSTGTQLKNPRMINNIKKDIARILSLLSASNVTGGIKKHE